MNHREVEEWADMIAQMQDDNSWRPKINFKKMEQGDTYGDISNYIKYNIESTERGHIIRIITETGIHTYNCKWKDYKRTGRPITKK
jgi:hypothetical protein